MSAEDREKWDARYEQRGDKPARTSRVLQSLEAWLPEQGRGLDVAGGRGGNALWLARRGIAMTVADISEIGLRQLDQDARRQGLAITVEQRDLEHEPLPAGPWDLILVALYLNRSLLQNMAPLLSSDGRLVVIHPTTRNLERHTRPPRHFLLQPGELSSLTESLDTLFYREDWAEDGRHDAVLVAGRPVELTSEVSDGSPS